MERQRWKEQLKHKLLIDKEQPKKRKIEILEDVLYKKDGTKIKVVEKKILPNHSSLPTTPHQPKVATIDVKDLTPTFRDPECYMSETRKIIENNDMSSVSQNPCTSLNDLFQEFPLISSDGETDSNIINNNLSSTIQDASHIINKILVTADSEEYSVPNNVKTEESWPATHQNSFNADEVPEMKVYLPVCNPISPSATESLSIVETCLPVTDQKNPSFAEVCPEIEECSTGTDLKSPSTTPDNPPVKEYLVRTDTHISSASEESMENKDCLPVIMKKCPNTAKVTPDAANAKVTPIPKDTEASTSNDTQEYISPEKKRMSRCLPRNCKKKLNFDIINCKPYLDFIEEDDATTLLLNEAFPSEASSCSFSDNESSDDSASSKTKKNKTKKKQGKVLKKKQKKVNMKQTSKSNEHNTDRELQVEENVLIPKPKPKKSAKKENKIKRAHGQTYTTQQGDEVASKCMKTNPCK
ncbi:uncharacterized protein LOC135087374 [Ostrinia nubilalis]|uniref:uncharacterized protein LOC135087374 n=1 Tax=Ostrinia nubilalis TaxID=29057 RepID=UPI003082501C